VGELDGPSLVGGVVLIAFGALLLLDRLAAIDLGFGALTPTACAAVGAVLLTLGLSRRR
jgi:hypothetical protein